MGKVIALKALTREEFKSAARFPPEWRALYQSLLTEALHQLQALPGYSVIHEMLVERAAYTFVAQKIEDAKDEEGKVNWGSYRDYVKLFMASIESLFREGRAAALEETFKRDTAYKVYEILARHVTDPETLRRIRQELEAI